MTNLAVLLYFNGRWDPRNKYINYLADGVLINTKSTFATLVSIIATQLSIDTSTSKVEIRYKIDERSPPIQIHNDMPVTIPNSLRPKNNFLLFISIANTSSGVCFKSLFIRQ
ncbi:hypothetical protein R3W88_029046 [Solanum pinnatisectum]|uniref:Uncharacterized protein n=1 Tax=Solanum pinnatisectum TaxID=50273 RepID=A0AAV9K457_9SOLN|nr:hypothetical protein R3W88_029046 [Solanum pinnatisectum]